MEVSGKRLDEYTVSERCEPCQEGNATTQADGYCNDCEEFMCQTCFQSHLKLKLGRNHVLGALDGERRKAAQTLEEKCKKHPAETIKFYCRNHDFVGCGDCIISDHRKCEPEVIRDLAKNFEESFELTNLLKPTQEWDSIKAETETRIERDRKENSKFVDNAVRDIKTFRKEINSWLDKMETHLHTEVTKISDDNETQMSKQEEKMKVLQVKINNIKEQLNTSVNKAGKLFIRSVECKPEICVVNKALSEIKSGYVINAFTFEPDQEVKKMLASSSKLGVIITVTRNKPVGKQTTKVQSSAKDTDILQDPRSDCVELEMPHKVCVPAQEKRGNAVSDVCVICLDEVIDPKTLECGHLFCTECISQVFKVKEACPTCGHVCGIMTGDQPDGKMTVSRRRSTLTGYEDCGTIIITYSFPSGIRQENHPNPGAFYKGITRTAYLPDNKEGNEVLQLLKIAFDRKLVFTIGRSPTTGQEGVITWNDIHHKTDPRPNTQFGYPDPGYLARVKDELFVKGVTMDEINK